MPDDELDDGAYLADPAGVLPSLSSLQVPEGKVSKNRVHLDVQVSSSGPRRQVPLSTR
ncbi:hypothetical protein [Cellulomonas fengjieae]|uniref:hypothetical protein n=1 Tax=Cellulomonas fengjieae TaxID=2819978 RepID=UPI001AAF7C63|nr:hypothetical protein [Cellulomonas fengjieae]MBO3100518.1 hypothetical protein [Cellulomonas fengjieae]